MRILFVINTIGFGGAEVFTTRLANALSRNGHSVFVYVHNYGFDGLNMLELFSPSVRVVYFHKNPVIDFLSWKFNAIFSFFKPGLREWIKVQWLKWFIARNKIQIISNQGIVTDELLAQHKMNVPVVSTIHEDYGYKYQKEPHSLMNRLAVFATKIDHFIYIADHSKNFLEEKFGIQDSKFTKIYNGFPYPYKPTRGTLKKAFVFGMIARGTPEKGWIEALEAFKLVYNSYNPVELILIGGKDYFRSLGNDYRHLPVTFIDSTMAPLEHIMKFDVGLLPSFVECLPNFIVECFSLGKPVIATNVGEIKQMITSPEGQSGLLTDLVDGKPDVNTLASHMVQYFSNKDLYNQHAFNTKFTFAKFDMKLCVDRYISCFESQIARMK